MTTNIIDIIAARELTGLPLVSAEDASDVVGTSYHDLERESESNAHASARERAIGYFTSRGFHVYPKGVGIDGV